jgi:hypothetical protein
MRHHTSIALCVALTASASFAQAQSIIDPVRRIDWTQAGVPGGPPNRTTVCATLSPGATAAQINSAIANCPSGQVVYLNAGTYNIGSPGLIFNDKSNVTLRGDGPDRTFLNFSAGNPCGGLGGDVCVINGDPNWTGDPGNVANWTAGYTKGTTAITLSHTTNLKVGTLIVLDQLDDPLTDNGQIWVCRTAGVCATEGQSGTGRNGRAQHQIVKVTAINGNTVTITPGLHMPNWRTSQTPQAWWSSDTPITGVGIENISLNHTSSSGADSGIYFFNAYGCWVKNVKSITAPRNHVWFYQSARITVRDSYFYGTRAAESESYGVEHFQASDNLVENNIFQHIAVPMMSDAGQGSVYGYNFSMDDFYDVADWAQASSYHHGPGNSYFLWEGNDGFGLTADNVHGTAHFITAFRNRWQGWEATKTLQTVPVHIYTFNRFFNIIGNVLGDNAYHTNYSAQVGGSSNNCDTSIYSLGWGGNCSSDSLPNDPLVVSSLMRWGNYDTVNDASRFLATEVPSSLSPYGNAVPANQTLPASFYLAAKPTWWGTMPWPPIGPDVTGGNVANVGGHAYKIPARLCYENSPKVNGILTFNAATCYPTSSGPTPPAAPANLRIIRD